MKDGINSFEDLKVYKKLCELYLKINDLSMTFPKLELHELGSQLRRSSNSTVANIAEAWNNKHVNIWLEGMNRSMRELLRTKHHLNIAFCNGYLNENTYQDILMEYDECGKMLNGLAQSF